MLGLVTVSIAREGKIRHVGLGNLVRDGKIRRVGLSQLFSSDFFNIR